MANAKTYPYTDEDGVLHIRYQDTYAFPSKIQEITDTRITSTVTGRDTPDPHLLLLREDGKSVYADGCGSATMHFCDGTTACVQVDPSPINLLFVTGQSNASGDPSYYDESYFEHYVRSPETMAYFTFCGQQVSIDVEDDKKLYQQAIDEDGCALWHTKEQVAKGEWEMPNFTDYHLNVTPTLDWETARVEKGCDPKIFSLRGVRFSTCGWNASLAAEWIKQTGERVWLVNCSQGGMEIQQVRPSEDGSVINNEYYQAVAVFNLALETLYKEVDAGHFTLHHMAYYWFQGESNGLPYPKDICRDYYGYRNRFKQNRGFSYLTAPEYVAMFTKMHEGFMRDVVYDHNGVRRELEFCGIMTIRYKWNDNTDLYDQIGINSIRAAQYYIGACNEGALKNVFTASNVTEQWMGETSEDASEKVREYFLRKYGSAENVRRTLGYDIPATAKQMIPNSHYLIYGHNEMGWDCARSTLAYINRTQPWDAYALSYTVEEKPTIRLLGKDGLTALTDAIKLEEDGTAVVYPQVTPVYLSSVGIRLELDEGYADAFAFDGYILTRRDATRDTVSFTLRYGGEVYGHYTFRVE